jgi:hypothetical protein
MAAEVYIEAAAADAPRSFTGGKICAVAGCTFVPLFTQRKAI